MYQVGSWAGVAASISYLAGGGLAHEAGTQVVTVPEHGSGRFTCDTATRPTLLAGLHAVTSSPLRHGCTRHKRVGLFSRAPRSSRPRIWPSSFAHYWLRLQRLSFLMQRGSRLHLCQ